MSIFNTVFAKNLQLHQMEMQRLQAQQAQQEEQRRYENEQVTKQLARADERRDAEFNRQAKVAEIQGKYLGMLGQALPKFTNPALQEMGEAAYMGGVVTQGQFNDKLHNQLDLETMRQGGQDTRAGANLAQRQTFHDDQMGWNQKKYDQDQSQFDAMMAYRRAHPPRGANISVNSNPFFGVENSLAKRFDQQPVVKRFRTITPMVGYIQRASPDGYGDAGLIYAWCKLLDPDTGIRDGERTDAQQAGRNIPQHMVQMYNSLVGGGKLTPQQREHFKSEAMQMYGQHKASFDAFAGEYERMATEMGANPRNVVIQPPSVTAEETGAGPGELEDPF